jgi:hypothetical protein
MTLEIPALGFLLRIAQNFVQWTYKWSSTYRKYKKLEGYYFVCNQQGIPFINSPEKIPNFLKIEVPLKTPSFINITSKDYDRTNMQMWKTWTNQIEMTRDTGKGYYQYIEVNEPGMHEIFLLKSEPGIIRVRVTDLGQADWRNKKDNKPSNHIWRKVGDGDPIVERFKTFKF